MRPREIDNGERAVLVARWVGGAPIRRHADAAVKRWWEEHHAPTVSFRISRWLFLWWRVRRIIRRFWRWL